MSGQKRDLISGILWLAASVIWFTLGTQRGQPILIGVGGLSIMVGMEYLKRWWKVWKSEHGQKDQNSKNSKNGSGGSSGSHNQHKKKK